VEEWENGGMSEDRPGSQSWGRRRRGDEQTSGRAQEGEGQLVESGDGVGWAPGTTGKVSQDVIAR